MVPFVLVSETSRQILRDRHGERGNGDEQSRELPATDHEYDTVGEHPQLAVITIVIEERDRSETGAGRKNQAVIHDGGPFKKDECRGRRVVPGQNMTVGDRNDVGRRRDRSEIVVGAVCEQLE
jgi:hypothetical protein